MLNTMRRRARVLDTLAVGGFFAATVLFAACAWF